MRKRFLLDTNTLIALSDPHHPLFSYVETGIKEGASCYTCSVAWHEYVRGPLLPEDRDRALRILEKRVMSLERQDAEFAAKLFNSSGRRRGSTADCLIAAVALRLDAECVTWNTDDFCPFLEHGLRICEL